MSESFFTKTESEMLSYLKEALFPENTSGGKADMKSVPGNADAGPDSGSADAGDDSGSADAGPDSVNADAGDDSGNAAGEKEDKVQTPKMLTEEVIDALRWQCVASLCSGVFAKATAENEATLKKAFASANETKHFYENLSATAELEKLLAAHDMIPVTVKGAAAAMYYANPSYRTMGDIDFYVVKKDGTRDDEAACEILKKNGYVYEGNASGRHDNFRKGGVHFELHHYLSQTDTDETDVRRNETIARGLKHPETRIIAGYEIHTLPDIENGIAMLTHILGHLRYGIGLRQIIDFLMYAYTVLDDETFAKTFSPVAKETKTLEMAKTVVYCGKKYLGMPDVTISGKPLTWEADISRDSSETRMIQNTKETSEIRTVQNPGDPEVSLADTEKTRDVFFRYVLASGNFKNRLSKGEGGSQSLSSMIHKNGFWKTAYRNGMQNWKAAREHKILRPLVPFYQIGRWTKHFFSKEYGGIAEAAKGFEGHTEREEMFAALEMK